MGGLAFEALLKDRERFRPALQVIASRHGLAGDSVEFIFSGSNVLARAGADSVIKLFCPLWGEQQRGEGACLKQVEGKLPIETPEVRGEGELEGWPYLVMRRLPGRTIRSVWDKINPIQRAGLAAAIGELTTALQEVPTAGMETVLESDWTSFTEERLRLTPIQQEKWGCPKALVAEMPGWLKAAQPLHPEGFSPCLLHADMTDENLLVEEVRGRWTLSGLVDFGDSLLGWKEYEWVTPAFLVCHREPALVQALVRGAGVSAQEMNEAMTLRLGAWSLLHRYNNITRYLTPAGPTPSLDELVRNWWRWEDS